MIALVWCAGAVGTPHLSSKVPFLAGCPKPLSVRGEEIIQNKSSEQPFSAFALTHIILHQLL